MDPVNINPDSKLSLKYVHLYKVHIKASADGSPKKSPTSRAAESGFHHHVVMTDKSGALNVYVQVQKAVKAHTVCTGCDKFCANIVIQQINLCVSVHILEYFTNLLCTKHYRFCWQSAYDVSYLK